MSMERISIAMRDEALWLAFRVECLKRRKSASQAVEELIIQQLEIWQQEDVPIQPKSRPRRHKKHE